MFHVVFHTPTISFPSPTGYSSFSSCPFRSDDGGRRLSCSLRCDHFDTLAPPQRPSSSHCSRGGRSTLKYRSSAPTVNHAYHRAIPFLDMRPPNCRICGSGSEALERDVPCDFLLTLGLTSFLLPLILLKLVHGDTEGDQDFSTLDICSLDLSNLLFFPNRVVGPSTSNSHQSWRYLEYRADRFEALLFVTRNQG